MSKQLLKNDDIERVLGLCTAIFVAITVFAQIFLKNGVVSAVMPQAVLNEGFTVLEYNDQNRAKVTIQINNEADYSNIYVYINGENQGAMNAMEKEFTVLENAYVELDARKTKGKFTVSVKCRNPNFTVENDEITLNGECKFLTFIKRRQT